MRRATTPRSGSFARAMLAAIAAICTAALSALGCSGQSGHEDADAGSGRCAQCHMPDYLDAPHHVGVKPTTCGVCHASERWTPTVKRHRWALTGAHARTKCFACHVGTPPKFEDTGDACVDCHLDTLEQHTFPEHLGYPRQCEHCHSTVAWLPATWNGRAIDAAEHEARVRGEAWVAPSAPVAETPDAGMPVDAGSPRARRVVVRRPRPRPTSPTEPTTPPTPPIGEPWLPTPTPVQPQPVPRPAPVTPAPRPAPVDTTTSASRR